VTDLITVFRTRSDVEASIVRGLLEAHGMPSVVSSHLPQSLFPMAVNTLGEIGIAVRAEDADEAQRIIESHRTEFGSGRSGQVVRLRDEFEALQQTIGYRFRDRGLLEHAMTHTSRANEDVSGGVRDNESLEFLGDAVLGFLIADLLFGRFPELDEGQKSKIKASLVSTATLAKLAERLSLGEHLLLGRGEEKTGGRQKQALLADTYEALIAAIYLDGGVEHVRAFVGREFATLVEETRVGAAQDYKSTLQELVQSRGEPLPEYRLVGAAGPDHRKMFQVEVVLNGEPVADATGRSKKEAEQEAAKLALDRLSRPR
jgi:ribonuclease III